MWVGPAGCFTCLVGRLPVEGGSMEWHTALVITTAHYLFGPMRNAIPRVQAEYWSLLIGNGIVL